MVISKIFKPVGSLEYVLPEYTVMANELFEAFNENESMANEKYLGKVIEVTGFIKDFNAEGRTVVLKTSDDYFGISCSFNENQKLDTTVFQEGIELKIRGECSGKLMDVALNNCVILK